MEQTLSDAPVQGDDSSPQSRWSIPPGQRFVFEEFDDGIVMFDAFVGATHLLNITAAETLAVVLESPGVTTSGIHALLLERLGVADEALPFAAVEELAWRLEDLGLIAAAEQ